MQRRQVLAALCALLPAGCLGAKRPDSGSGVRTEGPQGTLAPTDRPTDTPTPEPTETETPEPTETETPEPGPDEEAVEAGAEAIEAVQSELAAAVEAYTGDEDGDLTSVSVTGDSFDVRTVLLALDAVQSELGAASAAAATEDQRETVAGLRVAETFLTQSALVHSYFVDAVDDLDATEAAFAEDPDAAEDAEDRFDDTLERASDGVSTLKNDVDGDPVAVADPFDDDTYDDTVSRFETVRSVLEDASSGLDRAVTGYEELVEGREEEEDGNEGEAEDKAEEARDQFDEAYDFFDDAVDAAGDADLDDLESLLESFRELADEKYGEADDLYEDVS
jgi:hypothetical protein